jgi:hypothetical protein
MKIDDFKVFGDSIYVVSHGGPETYHPVIVVGPTVGSWKTFCDSLTDEAIDMAIHFNTEGNKNEFGNESVGNTINEGDLHVGLLAVLKLKGYTEIYVGDTGKSLVIDDDDYRKIEECKFGWQDTPNASEAALCRLELHNLRIELAEMVRFKNESETRDEYYDEIIAELNIQIESRQRILDAPSEFVQRP